MKLRIQLLRHAGYLQDTLQADGWTVEPDGQDAVLASHPDVTDAATARGRLDGLGLLTSGLVRVEFGPLRAGGNHV